jgi:hypothetical protein
MAARPTGMKWTKVLRLVCWNADGVRDKKQELDNFLGQHVIGRCLLPRPTSGQAKYSGWQTMSSKLQVNSRRRNSYTGRPRYKSPSCTRPWPTAPGDNCYPDHVGQEASEDPGGLPVTLTVPNRFGLR